MALYPQYPRTDDRDRLVAIDATLQSQGRLLDRMHQEFHEMSGTVSESHTAILKLQADHNDFKLALADRLMALAAQIAALKASIVPGLGADDLAMVNAVDTDTVALATELRAAAGQPPPVDPVPPVVTMPDGLTLDPMTGLMTDPATGMTWDESSHTMVPGAPPAPLAA